MPSYCSGWLLGLGAWVCHGPRDVQLCLATVASCGSNEYHPDEIWRAGSKKQRRFLGRVEAPRRAP